MSDLASEIRRVFERENPVHSAIGCLAFLRSVCRCGEKLDPNDEAAVEKAIEGLRPLEAMLFYTGAKPTMIDGVPRRCRVSLMTPAERAIMNAVQEVEALGCDRRLTDAIVLLAAARERVADYWEADSPRLNPPSVQSPELDQASTEGPQGGQS